MAVCRQCGCTDDRACMTAAGPCWWAEPDLCSSCAGLVAVGDLDGDDGEIGEEDCGMTPDGTCQNAGTEWCDWVCPFSGP